MPGKLSDDGAVYAVDDDVVAVLHYVLQAGCMPPKYSNTNLEYLSRLATVGPVALVSIAS